MPRGGRRRGAGAPKGNINAIRTGKYSPRARAAMAAMLYDPAVRRALVALVLQRPKRPSYVPRAKVAAARDAVAASVSADLGLTPRQLAALERYERLRRSMRHMSAMLGVTIDRRRRSVEFEVTEAAKAALVKEGFDRVFGARPLRRTVQRQIENSLAKRILSGEFGQGDVVRVDHDGESYTFEKAGHRAVEQQPEAVAAAS